MNTFRCPVCDAPCPTLRDLLECHPRELRRLTDRVGEKPLAGLGLPALIGKPLTPAMRANVRQFLNPEKEAS